MNIDFFVHNIKARCRIMGISPTEACRESGVGRGFMDSIKRGSSPSIDRVRMLAKFFDCTIGELIGEDTTGLSRGPDQPFLVMRFNALSKDDQEEILTLVEMKYLKALRECTEAPEKADK